MTVDKPFVMMLASVLAVGAVGSAASVASATSHTVYRTPPRCTSAALAAATNEQQWRQVLQAHTDLEAAALDSRMSVSSFRHRLAGMPAVPEDVDLEACR